MQLKPDYPNTYMVLGQITYNEGVDINNESTKIRPPQGDSLTAEQLQQKENLQVAKVDKFNEAIPYFKKVDTLLDGQGKLKMEEKETLKNALDLLIIADEEIAKQLESKKRSAELEMNTDDVKKYEAELKAVNADIARYTDKYNDVDNKH